MREQGKPAGRPSETAESLLRGVKAWMDWAPEAPAEHPADIRFAAYVDWLLAGALIPCPFPEVASHVGDCPICYEHAEELILAHLTAQRESRPATFGLHLSSRSRDCYLEWVSDEGKLLRQPVARLMARGLRVRTDPSPGLSTDPTPVPPPPAPARQERPEEQTSGEDRRASLRYRCALGVALAEDSVEVDARVDDISGGGLRVRYAELPETALKPTQLVLRELHDSHTACPRVEPVWWDPATCAVGYRFAQEVIEAPEELLPPLESQEQSEEWTLIRYAAAPRGTPRRGGGPFGAAVSSSSVEVAGLRVRAWARRLVDGHEVMLSLHDQLTDRELCFAQVTLLDETARGLRKELTQQGLVYWRGLPSGRYSVDVQAP